MNEKFKGLEGRLGHDFVSEGDFVHLKSKNDENHALGYVLDYDFKRIVLSDRHPSIIKKNFIFTAYSFIRKSFDFTEQKNNVVYDNIKKENLFLEGAISYDLRDYDYIMKVNVDKKNSD